MDERTCPACGMPQEEWGTAEGFPQEGQVYCCEGCADGTGCTCELEMPAQDEY